MNRLRFLLPLLAVFGGLVAACADTAVQGYSDTPIIPGTEWRVHDGNRPQPPVVTPGERFSHNAPAPSDATVLFDGTSLDRWESSRGGEARWKVEDGHMETVRGAGNIRTRDRFGDVQLHLEFASPAEPRGQGQGRGNSGVFFHGLYEVQILDSHENPTYPDGQAAALYGQTPPLVNASKAPGEWQTYDIFFEGPRWSEDGELERPARVTVIHNGVVVHHAEPLHGATRHRALADYSRRHEPEGIIELQDHGDPVRFRNIWVRPLRP
jgi:hypothetical protein